MKKNYEQRAVDKKCIFSSFVWNEKINFVT